MASANRRSSDLTVELRRGLLDRLGLYGLRLLVHEIQAGRCATGTDMARLLVTYSGLAGLRALIAERFLPRARVLQARAALGALRDLARKLSVDDPDAGRRLDADVERVESSVLDFGQLRLAHLVLSGAVTFSAEERAEMDRLLQVDDPLPVAAGAGRRRPGSPSSRARRWRPSAAGASGPPSRCRTVPTPRRARRWPTPSRPSTPRPRRSSPSRVSESRFPGPSHSSSVIVQPSRPSSSPGRDPSRRSAPPGSSGATDDRLFDRRSGSAPRSEASPAATRSGATGAASARNDVANVVDRCRPRVGRSHVGCRRALLWRRASSRAEHVVEGPDRVIVGPGDEVGVVGRRVVVAFAGTVVTARDRRLDAGATARAHRRQARRTGRHQPRPWPHSRRR